MTKNNMKRPPFLWLLVFLLVFLALGGFYGGISMLADPTGKALQMDEVLPLLPVPDYFLPGLFLLSIMGIVPLLLVYGLIWQPRWGWANWLSSWSKHYWAWTGSIVVGIVLMIWLAVQGLLIGFQWPIQYMTLTNGILIILVALFPSVRSYFETR
ncbi:MAG: hypothetical protein DYG86_14095 [Chloroflexi bacterium CFX2]|nr:hypothetical protein [Chloroflexi bacterium CFX2]